MPESKTGPKTIQLPPPARAVLSGVPRISHYVIPNARGTGPMKDLGLRWQKLRGLAGLEGVRIHDCRHTLASHAVMNGIDLYTVGRLLGHADIGSTERYAHLADDHIREAACRIGEIVEAAMTGGREREGCVMARRHAKKPLTRSAIAAAKPGLTEYTLWEGALAHFGVRVQPSGVRSFVIQTRVRGRMRKLTLGRFPETALDDARREAATVLARVWAGDAVALAHKP